jgi:hypothetical protein
MIATATLPPGSLQRMIRRIHVVVANIKVTIVRATLGFDEWPPIKTLQRLETFHEHLENGMWVANANTHLSSFENPKDILSEWALVGRLHPNLIKLVNPHRDRSAERTLENKGIVMQPVVRAQIGRNQEQRLR